MKWLVGAWILQPQPDINFRLPEIVESGKKKLCSQDTTEIFLNFHLNSLLSCRQISTLLFLFLAYELIKTHPRTIFHLKDFGIKHHNPFSQCLTPLTVTREFQSFYWTSEKAGRPLHALYLFHFSQTEGRGWTTAATAF